MMPGGAPVSTGAMAQAMGGLEREVRGPAIGWANDPSLAATAEGLGDRTPSPGMNALARILGKTGRLY